MIDASSRRLLVALARAALEARVRGQPVPKVPAETHVRAAGLFVTIRYRGDLRGCLGTLEEAESLGEAVARLAADISCEDHRFQPIAAGELAQVTLDLSVLTPTAVVNDVSTIVIGRDGLIVEQGRHRGLLLPQVATEHGWDRDTFLSQTCVKAGLPPEAWRRGATILRFQAEVFGDDDL